MIGCQAACKPCVGPVGAPGANPCGATGPTGRTGPTGESGSSGARGALGLKGLKGDVGATGPAGVLEGAQGAKGSTSTGPRGSTGDKGPLNIPFTGPAGAKGESGLAVPGKKGDRGEFVLASFPPYAGTVRATARDFKMTDVVKNFDFEGFENWYPVKSVGTWDCSGRIDTHTRDNETALSWTSSQGLVSNQLYGTTQSRAFWFSWSVEVKLAADFPVDSDATTVSVGLAEECYENFQLKFKILDSSLNTCRILKASKDTHVVLNYEGAVQLPDDATWVSLVWYSPGDYVTLDGPIALSLKSLGA